MRCQLKKNWSTILTNIKRAKRAKFSNLQTRLKKLFKDLKPRLKINLQDKTQKCWEMTKMLSNERHLAAKSRTKSKVIPKVTCRTAIARQIAVKNWIFCANKTFPIIFQTLKKAFEEALKNPLEGFFQEPPLLVRNVKKSRPQTATNI